MGASLALASAASAAFPQGPPNDPLFNASPLPNSTSEQWDLASPAAGFDRGISADRAWALSTGAGVTIADVDVGVQLDHPDLANRWAINPGETGRDSQGRDRATNGVDDDHNGYVDDWRGWDFYGYDNNPTSDTHNPHGTNVAGVLGAGADNGIGIAGVAPGARLLPIRTSDNILHQGVRVGEAIVYAADRGARAISMSLGTDSFSTPLRRAVRYAHRRGVVMAVAAGNEFHFHHHYPQVMDDVLAVGGINPDSANLAARDPRLAQVATGFVTHASYADYGPHLDVVAPTQVETTEWGGGYRNVWDGTSAATPHVAAVAGLIAARGKAVGIALSADEIMQIVRMTADDLSDPSLGYAPGWDMTSGWGRVNAFAAVSRVAPGRIPPVANITGPDWYQPERSGFRVTGIATGRSATSWRLELGAGDQPTSWREIANGGATGAHARTLARVDARQLAAGPWTLRMRATDAQGNTGEDRELFHVLRDPALKRGYPKPLGTSGESSPTLADVNGDHRPDIVLATAGGQVHVWSGRTGRELRGWPRSMDAAPGSGPVARRIGTVRSGFLGTAAVGDVAGGRRPEVVATGLDGKVYAWTAGGRRLRGFPFHIALRGTAEQGRLDGAIYASPALADLDRDGKLDIVFGAADQRIYALKGNGRPVPGWPVLARDVGAGGDVAKILSSPAIGDLNGDGSPDVVEGTAEAYGSTPNTSGRVYAFSAKGKPLPGWPVKPPALAANSIPLAGQGVPMSPVLADVDGDHRDEVAVASFTGEPELYRGDGTRMGGAGGQSHFDYKATGAGSRATSPSVLALGANAAFGRTAPSGPLQLFGGVVDSRLAAAQGSPGTKIDFQHLLGGWDAASGSWASSFPIPMEGWQIPSAPAVADVDGDGKAEVIAGSSGDVLHAFRQDGSEPTGWPKDTGGWLLASPAVGDVDGDGKLEVVAVTRDGYLYVWDTPARAGGQRQWPSFRHDPRNSGRYGLP
ncbi:MAG: cell wall-associated protease [Thermoleophilaceae bacterium]|nr:cell wall-associated protease [Thermoleophilaceae bacterium]